MQLFCSEVLYLILSSMFLFYRPVPGSLSSLLHLHNRQRQPMPASMPGTLPNPTMPGSSAVLMPVCIFLFFSTCIVSKVTNGVRAQLA